MCLGNTNCKTGQPPELNWHPKFYFGDSRSNGFQGSSEFLTCTNVRIDSMVAMESQAISDLKKEYTENINQCEKWSSPNAFVNALKILYYLDQIEQAHQKVKNEKAR